MQKFHPSAKKAYLASALLVLLAALPHFLASFPYSEYFLAAAIALAALHSLFSYLATKLTSFTVAQGSLIVEKTLLSVERRVIPIKNIDNLRISSSLTGRLLSLCDIYVDTAGGDKVEVVLRDIDAHAATAIEQAVGKPKGDSS